MHPLRRLQWQCRRGTKELDLLLQRYLDQQFHLADTQEQHLFEELLQLEDDVLIAVLLGDAESGRWQGLVEKIKS